MEVMYKAEDHTIAAANVRFYENGIPTHYIIHWEGNSKKGGIVYTAEEFNKLVKEVHNYTVYWDNMSQIVPTFRGALRVGEKNAKDGKSFYVVAHLLDGTTEVVAGKNYYQVLLKK